MNTNTNDPRHRDSDLIITPAEEKPSERIFDEELFLRGFRNKLSRVFPRSEGPANDVRLKVKQRLTNLQGSKDPEDIWRSLTQMYGQIVYPANVSFVDAVLGEMGIVVQHSPGQVMAIESFTFEDKTYRLNPETRSPEAI